MRYISRHVLMHSVARNVNNGLPISLCDLCVITGAGMWHFMVGVSGKELYTNWQDAAGFPWMANRDATFWGTAYLEVPNATHARCEWGGVIELAICR